jgi:anti-anti-sigma factor
MRSSLAAQVLGKFPPAIVSFSDHPPLLRLAGDEDRATASLRRTALSRAMKARGDLVVDLSALTFADPSLMLDLAMVARRLRKRERRMWVRGAQPHVRRLIELVGLHRLPAVTLDDAAAPALA